MAAGEGSNHWLVGTSIPVILAALGVAASAGILYNSVGRIVFLEAELSDRSNYLPARITAERLKNLEAILTAAPGNDVKLQAQIDGLAREIARLNSIAERAVIEWNDIKSRVSRMEATVESMQERARHLRDDLNSHREDDASILRDRLRSPPAAITTSPR